MSDAEISKEDLAARARAVGLELSDQRLEELLPEMQEGVEAFMRLAALDLQGFEPAVTFKPRTE